MATPLAILGGAYTDETRPLSSQDTCNYILFPAEKAGTRTEGQLIDAPGLVPFAGVGDGPHRGARDVEGKLFVVSGNKLYQVAPTGVATEIGVIPGTGHVSITHNQIENGNQVLIGTRDNSYVYNTVTGALAATGVPLFSVDFINQLFVGVDQGRRFWRYSALVDGTDWNSLDNEGAESSPDRIVGLIVSQGEVLVFGERTIEVWSHSPTSSTAFQRVQVIERGCASPDTICRLDNSVIFLGNDNILYRLEGYSPRPISTHVLTREWGNRDPRKAFAFTYEDKGRVIYYLTHKDGQTFGYDVTTGEFHRRESYGFNRWRLNTLVKWAGSWYGGDFADGTLWRLDWRYMKEGCDEIARYRRTGVLSDNQRRVTVNSVELLLDTGREIEVTLDDAVSITGVLPDMAEGEQSTFSYSFAGTFTGSPATFELLTGALPTGLSLLGTGEVTGIASTLGAYSWTIRATDSCGNSAELADSATVTETTLVALNASALPLESTVLAWSPDSSYLASSGYGGTQPDAGWNGLCLVVHKRVGDVFTQIDPPHNLTDRAQGMDWSNDSTKLIVTGDQGNAFMLNRVGDVFTVGTTYPDQSGFAQERSFNFSLDENFVFIPMSDNAVKAWTVAGAISGSGASLTGQPTAFQCMDYHPTLDRAALATTTGVIILSVSGGTLVELQTLTATVHSNGQARYSPDGNYLAVSTTTGCKIWSVDGDTYTEVTGLPVMDPCFCLDWSGDNFHLLVGPYYLKKSGATFVQQAVLPFAASAVGAAAYSDNGQYLAVSAGGIWIYRVDT